MAHGAVADTKVSQIHTLPWVLLTLIVLIMGVRETINGY